ncbi:MAG: SPOR domain-containing protein [Granulosicoccus sp.]
MSLKDASDVAQSALLSDATLAALDLAQQPFGQLDPNSNTFSDETTAEQLADVKQALITGDDLLLILGAEGSGKSVMLKQLGEHSGLRIQCFAVKGSERFSTMNLFAGLLEAFKHSPPEKLQDILDDLIPYLQTLVSRNTLSIVVLDDADHVSEAELTQLLSSMLYVNSQDETVLRIAMAAHPEFEERIPDLLPPGADLPYSSLMINGLSTVRATDFLDFRARQAGLMGEPLLSEEEVDGLVHQSEGLPGPLLAAAANALNEEHGPVKSQFGSELVKGAGGAWLQSRFAKIAMGVLASLFILLGILMFLPGKSNEDSTRYTVTTQPINLGDTDESELKLVNNSTGAAANQSSAGSTFSGNASISLNGVETSAQLQESAIAEANSGQSAEEQATSTIGAITDENRENSAAKTPIVIVPESGANSEGTSTASSVSTAEEAEKAGTTAPEITPESVLSAAPAPQTDSTPSRVPSSAPSQETASVRDTPVKGELESSNWILIQDRNRFTVQMSASRDRNSVVNFLNKHAQTLPAPNSIYSFARNGSTWYALLHGLYDSIEDARAAVEGMPAEALVNQPWIRSVGRVQDVLKDQ